MGKTRRTGTKNPALLAQAKRTAQKILSTAKVQVRQDLPQEQKISHALQTLLRIDVPEGSPLSTYRIALDWIVLAWNASLQAPEKQAQVLREIADRLTEADPSMQRQALEDMKKLLISKQVFFPDDKRLVVSWDVMFNGPRVFVSAAALMAPSDEPPMSQS